MKRIDYIVVGQGLAGSAVAMQLLFDGRTVLVIDQPSQNTSSVIAAGLFNPITGKVMSRTWMADILYPYLFKFYRAVEKATQCEFFHPLPIYRPFLSVGEQNEWMAASADPRINPFIKSVFTKAIYPYIKDPFGGILLQQSGYLDTRSYVEAVKLFLRGRNAFFEGDFNEEDLKFSGDHVAYGNYAAKRIIFCEGVRVLNNKWFNWLPVHALKGETLTINACLTNGVIPNRGVYVVPGSVENEWRVGATYEHHFQEKSVTEKARIELEYKLKELITAPYSISNQHWGLRPTTTDYRPLLGAHPDDEKIVVFNGFGTKGVSLTPYFSHILIRWLENKEPINKEVDITRYKSLYWKSAK